MAAIRGVYVLFLFLTKPIMLVQCQCPQCALCVNCYW